MNNNPTDINQYTKGGKGLRGIYKKLDKERNADMASQRRHSASVLKEQAKLMAKYRLAGMK